MARGQVIFVAKNGGAIVVRSAEGFTVAELLGNEGELQNGDQVRGEWSANGGENIYRDDKIFEAYFQGCWGAVEVAVNAARRIGG